LQQLKETRSHKSLKKYSETTITPQISGAEDNFDVTIVIPFLNEEESLPLLLDWILKVQDQEKKNFEIIGVNDGSSDRSWKVIQDYNSKYPNIKGISFRRNLGKSAALNAAFKKASGRVVITMDADLQDSPDEIPELYDMIVNQGFDLVSGWKKKRHDPISKTVPSKFFNGVTRIVSGIKLHDFNCGLKAYNRDVVKAISIQGEMHRYIPVIAKRAGFPKIGEKVVEHRAREHGVTKFGLERFVNGFLDLLTVTFISKFGNRPMHFFGLWGALSFFLGFLAAAYIGVMKAISISKGEFGNLVTDSPFFYIALTLMIIGVQLFLSGYLGELISRQKEADEWKMVEEELM